MSDTTCKYIKLFGDDRDKINYSNLVVDSGIGSVLHNIASSILNKHRLIIPVSDELVKEYRICEIEFYVRTPEHNDPSVQMHQTQTTYGKWFFHRTQSGSYKGGTTKALELTLGSKIDGTDIYFGVLIKSIYSETDNEFIEGACRVVNKILESNRCKSIEDYVSKLNHSDPLNARFSQNIHIKRCSNMVKYDTYVGPRTGLTKCIEFKDKPYRYAIMVDKIARHTAELKKIETGQVG